MIRWSSMSWIHPGYCWSLSSSGSSGNGNVCWYEVALFPLHEVVLAPMTLAVYL